MVRQHGCLRDMSEADDGVPNRTSSRRGHQDVFRLPPDRLRDDFRGTFAPFSLASLRPIAIACFRLFTRPPEPLFNVPFLRRCIADFTVLDAALPYLAINASAPNLQTPC
jgi:hypothetical protein